MESVNLIERNLTSREQEIISLIAKAKSTKDIANICYISEGTVKQHLNKIYKKLGVKSRLEAAIYFLKMS